MKPVLIVAWVALLGFALVSTFASVPGGAALDVLRLCAILLLCVTGFLGLLAPVLGRSDTPPYVRPTPPEFEAQSLDSSPGIVISAVLHGQNPLVGGPGDHSVGG